MHLYMWFKNINVYHNYCNICNLDTTSLTSTENLSVTQVTQHSITLSWTSVSGSFGYYISYERLDFSVPVTPTYMRLGGSDNTSVTLNKLTAGTRHMIRVWATYGSGVSQPIEKAVKTKDDSEFNVKLYIGDHDKILLL